MRFVSRGCRSSGGPIGIVGYIPAGTFQVESALGNKPVQLTGAVPTFFQRFVRKLLDCFFDTSALSTFIFINRHCKKNLPAMLSSPRSQKGAFYFVAIRMTYLDRTNIVIELGLSRV